ncbi:hypothetical protein BDF22DRAFT_739993 [Syncephalis plumigaleata]|nr:hypothetical protein BDF22DRAFT_739993 [Syncephalis plumigaleata]
MSMLRRFIDHLPRCLGGKSSPVEEEPGLSFTGGVSLLVSSMTGPALVTIPVLYQNAGWVLPTLVFIIVGIVSGCSSAFVCEVLSDQSRQRVSQEKMEFGSLAESFFSRRWRIPYMYGYFYHCRRSILPQSFYRYSMDRMLLTLAGRTCGLEFYPKFQWYALVTIGIVGPLGFLRLVDNAIVQIASMAALIIITIGWMVTFCQLGLKTERLPAITADSGQVVGTVLFNYAFITTVPSWINSKQPSVSTKKSIWWSIGISTVLYILLGVLDINLHDNLFIRISSYVFPIAVLITSIPVFTIVVRYNLVRGQLVGKVMANFLAGVLPWIIAIPFQTGDLLMTLMNWASLFFTSAINFILPFIMYLLYRRYSSYRTSRGPSTRQVPTLQIIDYSTTQPGGVLNRILTNSIRSSINNSNNNHDARPSPMALDVSKSNEEILETPLTPKITLLPAGCDTQITLPNVSTTSLKAESSLNCWPLHARSASVSSKDDGSASGVIGDTSNDITMDRMPIDIYQNATVSPTSIVTNLRDRRTSAPEVQSYRQMLISTDGATSVIVPSLDKDTPAQTVALRPHAKSMGDLNTLRRTALSVVPASTHALSPTELFSGSSSVRSELRHSMSSLRRTFSWYSRSDQRASHIQSSSVMTGHETPSVLSPGLPPSSQIPFFKAFSERWRPKVICQVCLIFMVCSTIASIVYDIVGQLTGH